MSESQKSNRVEVDEVDEENSVFVVDPDDYQKTRKVKAINDAKDHVRKLREEKPLTAKSREWDAIHRNIANAVAMYGSELFPLIEDAKGSDVLTADDLIADETGTDIAEFVAYDGRIPDHEKEEIEDASPIEYMAVYRQLDRIQRKMGLGLQLEEDKGPANI